MRLESSLGFTSPPNWDTGLQLLRRTYLVDDVPFVEIPVSLDAIWELRIAGVAASLRRGTFTCI